MGEKIGTGFKVGIERVGVGWILGPQLLNLIFSTKFCQIKCSAAAWPKKVPQSC